MYLYLYLGIYILLIIVADGNRKEVERDNRASASVPGARGESLTFCLARVPCDLTIECDDDAIMIAWHCSISSRWPMPWRGRSKSPCPN